MEQPHETLGNYIKSERVKRSISLEQISYATRISMKMLRALEDDDHGSLPAPAFVRGYLQAYAKYVSVDPQDLMLRYQHHLATASNVKRSALRSHYLYVKERYQEKRQLLLIVSLVGALIVSAGTYFVLKGKRERRKAAAQVAALTPAPTPGDAVSTPVVAPPAVKAEATKPVETKTDGKAEVKTETKQATPPAPTPAAEPDNTPKTYNLSLTATEDVWLRFQADTGEIKDLMLRKEKTIWVRAHKVIKIFSGNLGAIKANFNGQEMKSLMTADRSKSVVLPSSEAANHPLPLFPPQAHDPKPEEKKD